MDIATIIGLGAGFMLIIVSIMLGGSIVAFINIPSLLVTIGGAFSAILICYPLNKVLLMINLIMQTIFNSVPSVDRTIEQMMRINESYQKEGNKGIEKEGEKAKNIFLKKALILIEEGNNAEIINSILKRDIANLKDRHKTGQNILASLGVYAPAFGMIGTLMGLIQMLRNLSDPSQIGAGMSVALLTTFYGAVFANLIAAPLSEKLKDRSKDESLVYDLMREGIVAMVSGAKKREVQNRLVVFLGQKSRRKFDK